VLKYKRLNIKDLNTKDLIDHNLSATPAKKKTHFSRVAFLTTLSTKLSVWGHPHRKKTNNS